MTRSKASRETRRRAREAAWALGSDVPGRVRAGAVEMPSTFGARGMRRRDLTIVPPPPVATGDEPEPPAAA